MTILFIRTDKANQLKINNMEPNIFVSYIKVDMGMAKWYTSKAFLSKEDAELYDYRLADELSRRVIAWEVKHKVLTLAVNAHIKPTGLPEPTVEYCIQRAVIECMEFADRHRL